VSLDDLYREVILDHYSHPRNRGTVEPADVVREGANPLCGDEIRISLRVRGDVVEDIRFEGKGCSISQASASMMTELVKGAHLGDVVRLIQAFKGMMHGEPVEEGALGDLQALAGVRKFPVRVKCATLSWSTLELALAELGAGRGDRGAGPAGEAR
jgi:nitrogen fixation NifU-like protein